MPGLPFVARAGASTSGRTLADHLGGGRVPTSGPAPASWLTRASGGSGRTLADHLVPPAPPASTPPAPAAGRIDTAHHGSHHGHAARDVPPAARPAPTPEPPAPPAPRVEARVGQARASERRVVLDDDHPVVTLTAADLPRRGALRMTLRWAPQVTSTGLRRGTDVHLACLWETTNGYAGLLQSGGATAAPGFGARQVLGLGARSEEDGELLLADLANLDLLRRFVLLLYGKHQRPDWPALQPRVVVGLPTGGRLEVPAGSPPAQGGDVVVLASAYLVRGDVVLRREDDFVTGPARAAAEAYGWDLPWTDDGTALRP